MSDKNQENTENNAPKKEGSEIKKGGYKNIQNSPKAGTNSFAHRPNDAGRPSKISKANKLLGEIGQGATKAQRIALFNEYNAILSMASESEIDEIANMKDGDVPALVIAMAKKMQLILKSKKEDMTGLNDWKKSVGIKVDEVHEDREGDEAERPYNGIEVKISLPQGTEMKIGDFD